ncbi:MAG: response regulator [Polyangiaceae bacterium]
MSARDVPAFHGLPIGRRVLVAEDEPAMREVLETVLRECGYQVASVSTGTELDEALTQRRSTPFDLIVSDVRMPGASGLDVIDRLRESGDATPAVIVTAFPQAEIRERARGLEVRLLPKPFELDALRAAVDWAIRANAPRQWRPL